MSATPAHLASQLSAVLHAAARDMANVRDEHSLQRAAWLIDVAQQLADDLTAVLEGPDGGAPTKAEGN